MFVAVLPGAKHPTTQQQNAERTTHRLQMQKAQAIKVVAGAMAAIIEMRPRYCECVRGRDAGAFDGRVSLARQS